MAHLVHTAHTIAFNSRSAYTLDVATLEGERPTWTTAALLESAAAYGGELLPGFYESWIVLERARLAVVFDRRMGRLLERLITEERWDDTLAWAERWIDLDDAPEPAYRALMRAYAALGDASGVMITYRRCRAALWVEMGVAPSPETRRLVESLTHGAAAEPHPAATTAAAEPGARERPPGPAVADERQGLKAALARVEVERQRADCYRLGLSMVILLISAAGATLAQRQSIKG